MSFWSDPIGSISDTVSHVGEVIAKDPVANAVVSLGSNFVVPGSGAAVTAALAANQIAQGVNPEKVLANAAGNYVLSSAGNYVNTSVRDALVEQGLSKAAATAAATVSSGVANGSLRALATGKDVGSAIDSSLKNGIINAATGAADIDPNVAGIAKAVIGANTGKGSTNATAQDTPAKDTAAPYGISPEVLALIMSSLGQQQQQAPTQVPLVDLKSASKFDPFGKFDTREEDTANAAQGGSISDLIRMLRS